jgi:hypothetical protein
VPLAIRRQGRRHTLHCGAARHLQHHSVIMCTRHARERTPWLCEETRILYTASRTAARHYSINRRDTQARAMRIVTHVLRTSDPKIWQQLMSNRKAFDLKMLCAWHNGILAAFSLVVFLGQCYETYVESNVRCDMPAHKWTLAASFSHGFGFSPHHPRRHPPSQPSFSTLCPRSTLPSPWFSSSRAMPPPPPAPSLDSSLPQAGCNPTQDCTEVIPKSCCLGVACL